MDRHKWVLPAAFAVIVLGLVAVMVFVNRRPDQDIVGTAIDKLLTTETLVGGLAVDTFIDPDSIVPDSGWGSIDLPARISGPVEFRSAVSGGRLAGQARLDFRLGGSDEPLLTVEMRSPGTGRNFLRLQGLPDEEAAGLSLQELNGDWFELNESETVMLLPWLRSGSDNKMEVVTSGGGDGNSWMQPLQRLTDTVMEGRPVLHYELSVDSNGLVGLLSSLSAGLVGRQLTAGERADLRSYLSSRDLIAEGYIDRKSEMFRAIKIGLFPPEGQDGQPVAVTLTLDRLNDSVTVPVPENSRPLSSSLLQLLSVATE